MQCVFVCVCMMYVSVCHVFVGVGMICIGVYVLCICMCMIDIRGVAHHSPCMEIREQICRVSCFSPSTSMWVPGIEPHISGLHLQAANALCRAVQHPDLGVCFECFSLTWSSPSRLAWVVSRPQESACPFLPSIVVLSL